MRYCILTFLVLCTSFLHSQDITEAFELVKDQQDVEGFVWKDEQSYTDFDLERLAAFPDDDAVILNKSMFLTTKKIGKKLRFWFMRRDVTYIRNKGAIDEYSTIKLKSRDVRDKFNDHAVRVFKTNGETIVLKKDDYIEDGDELKVVIPNLEEGDIIDQYSFIRDDAFFYVFKVLFSDEIFFAHRYPVLDQRCEFILKNGSYFKFTPINDAPVIQIERDGLPVGINAKVVIHDKDRPAYDVEERWSYAFKELPVIRYSLAVGTGYQSDFNANFFDKAGFATTATSDAMISEFLERRFPRDRSATGIKKKNLKKMNQKVAQLGLTSDRDKMKAYYHILMNTVHQEMSLSYDYYGTRYMIGYLAQYARELGVESKWLYVFPRFYGDRDAMFLPNEIYPMLELTFEEGPEYIQFVHHRYPFGFYSDYLEDSDGFEIPNTLTAVAGGGGGLDPIHTRLSDAERNRLDVTMDLEINEDKLVGDLIHAQYGHESLGSIRTCDPEEFDCDVVQRLLGKRRVQEAGDGIPDHSEEDLYNLYKENDKTGNLAKFAEWMISTVDKELKSRFGEEHLEEVKEMKILDDGLMDAEKGFSYTSPIELKDMIKELGENKLVEVGALIGSQVEIDQESRTRHGDVNYGSARTYVNTLDITLPEGFRVEGWEDLAMDLDNEVAAFIVESSLSDGVLHFEARKIYKSNHVSLEDWPLLLEMLDAAYDFSQKKILLKPLNSEE